MFRRLTNALLATVVRRLARHRGFIDPLEVLSHLRRFAQPSEVAEPGELLRHAAVFHARGLMNRAIQYNPDWVWPYWARRQFDPHDVSFIPRAFSITHINLTNRNWTAIGSPEVDELPIVDPRGLVTPYFEGWSLDAWFLPDDGTLLAPSREDGVTQQLAPGAEPRVTTTARRDGMALSTVARAGRRGAAGILELEANIESSLPGSLWISVRPYNPEGIYFVYTVRREGPASLVINDRDRVEFDDAPEHVRVSTYRDGDVAARLGDSPTPPIRCGAGMATAAAGWRVDGNGSRRINASVPIGPARSPAHVPGAELDRLAQADLPDKKWQFLYEAAVHSMALHVKGRDVYPGSSTYRRFWFRDAAFILHAMMHTGFGDSVARVLAGFPKRQMPDGYFLSQEGEWDSNGEAIWVAERYTRVSGRRPPGSLLRSVERAANWIVRKLDHNRGHHHLPGLLPAGFSAEHLGLNDYYYWDNFWCCEGLRAAARLHQKFGDTQSAKSWVDRAARYERDITRYLEQDASRLGHPSMPAAPRRRIDAGMIGSVVSGYPLQFFPPGDERLRASADTLIHHYCTDGPFLHHMGHSGYNAYLTLHVAQTLLRAGDERYRPLAESVRDLASPTGQWPEGIHPRTLGGSMGDGHHIWAAAEWAMMTRNLFVREEAADRTLVIGSGVFPEWQREGCRFGPTPTLWGPVSVAVDGGEQPSVRINARFHGRPPVIHLAFPGAESRTIGPDDLRTEIPIARAATCAS